MFAVAEAYDSVSFLSTSERLSAWARCTRKMHDETVDVQTVIKLAMDKAAAQAERSLCFAKAESYTSAEAMVRHGTVLAPPVRTVRPCAVRTLPA